MKTTKSKKALALFLAVLTAFCALPLMMSAVFAGSTQCAEGHTPGRPVQENIVNSTCTKAGSYDEVIKCTVCNTEISRTQKEISMLEHSYTVKNYNGDYIASEATRTAPTLYYYSCVCGAKGTDTFEDGTPIPGKITYMVNGKVFAEQTVIYGQKIVPPTNASLPDKKFVTWGDVPETMPEEDLTFEGQFEPLPEYDYPVFESIEFFTLLINLIKKIVASIKELFA